MPRGTPNPRGVIGHMAHGLHGQVFGGVALRADGRDVAVRGHRRRLLVGLLLAEAPRVVAVEQIAHALWGDDPDTGDRVNAVHAHVVRLRRLLDPDPERAREWLRSESGGYALRPDDVDLWEYERSIARARDLSDDEADQAMGLIEQALALWSRPWGELADHPSLVEYVRRAELRHRSVEERWAALALDTGRGAELADQVVALATADPTREQRWSMAMRALTIAGRQAEALALYDEARRMLAEELGIDPGPELRATHQAVLRQDAALQRHVRQRGPTHATGGDPFVGRLEELDSLDLLTVRSRVVTVAGLGGLGKSRLVREWANTRSRAQRTRWIDLRGVESDAVVIRMATELSLVLSEDTPAHALDMVRSSLRHTRTLLIIDNADSVAMSVAETIAVLVADIPHLSVVVTSRQPLGLTEERVLTLTPLPSSPEGSLLSGTAEELAYERLGPTATNARARAVAAATGGMPVAIEMVAARVRHDPEHVVAGPGAAGDAVRPGSRRGGAVPLRRGHRAVPARAVPARRHVAAAGHRPAAHVGGGPAGRPGPSGALHPRPAGAGLQLAAGDLQLGARCAVPSAPAGRGRATGLDLRRRRGLGGPSHCRVAAFMCP